MKRRCTEASRMLQERMKRRDVESNESVKGPVIRQVCMSSVREAKQRIYRQSLYVSSS